MLKYQYICLIFSILLGCSHSAKVLGIFPYPSKSHQILGSALLKELALRGHTVTMISPFPLKEPFKNYNDVNLDGIIEGTDKVWSIIRSTNVSNYDKLMVQANNMNVMSEVTMESNGMQEFLKKTDSYDVVIQFWAMTEYLLGLGHKLNASTIAFSAIGNTPFLNYATGNPNPYSYVPNIFLSYTDNMSFIERVINTLANGVMDLLIHVLSFPIQKHLLKKYFPEAPPLEELLNNVDLALVNSHFATETPRPYLPNVKQIGGFHLQEKVKLSDELKKYLDAATNGVIFFSFGSNVKSEDIPESVLNAIIKTFQKSKYEILWKFDGKLPYIPSNVRISKWLPQIAILAHHNVKIFLTHGGLGSTVEAVFHGVPMICVPFFGDQMKNVKDSVYKGYAVQLNILDINEESLTNAINEITQNPMYLRNIQLSSDLLKNQEINPMDKAVFWVEHVIKHKGAKHLKSRATQIPWYQYMLLDVITFLVTITFIVLLVVYFIFKTLFKLCKKDKKIKMN